MTDLEKIADRLSLACAGMGIVMNEINAVKRALEKLNEGAGDERSAT